MAAREPLERPAEACPGEGRWVDTVGDVAWFAQRAVDFRPCVSDPLVVLSLVFRLGGHGEVDRGRHQPLLCAVVEVTFEFASLSLACAREPRARVGELVAR